MRPSSCARRRRFCFPTRPGTTSSSASPPASVTRRSAGRAHASGSRSRPATPVGAALRTPPYNLVVATPRDRGAVAALADAIDDEPPGAVGARPEVDEFARLCAERHELRPRVLREHGCTRSGRCVRYRGRRARRGRRRRTTARVCSTGTGRSATRCWRRTPRVASSRRRSSIRDSAPSTAASCSGRTAARRWRSPAGRARPRTGSASARCPPHPSCAGGATRPR